MIAIYAEKPDVGKKIAAALDCITLASGKKITFEELKKYDKEIKSQQHKDGYLKINFNGEETYVTWGYGHLCEIYQAYDYNEDYKKWTNIPLPFIPPEYQYKINEDTKKQFYTASKIIKSSKYAINATDYDREGEMIWWAFTHVCGYKGPFKRVLLMSQTKEGFVDAFNNLKDSSFVKNMTDAGRGRSIADWVIGANLTVAMTLKYAGHGVLSVGRVQTPTLNMLVEKEKAIKNFKKEKYYVVEANFTTNKNESFKGEQREDKRYKTLEEANAIKDKINGSDGKIKSVDKKTWYKSAPPLNNLSSLQMAANAKYGFTLEQTLNIAQALYEGGFTTYPRTDSQFLTEDMEPVINKTLDMLQGIPEYGKYIDGKSRRYDRKRYFDDSKVTSHFAIIPTTSIPNGLTDEQQKIYDIIAKSVIMMLYPAAEIEKTLIITAVKDEEFLSRGNIITKKSWLELDKMSEDTVLPDVKTGDVLAGIYETKEKETTPPKRFTDKTLVSAMISAGKELDDDQLKKMMDAGVKGIGTEATRAAIIENLVTKGYVQRDKKSIFATEKGIALIDSLPISQIKSAELTAKWESRLNDISLGKDNLNLFTKDIEQLTKDWYGILNTEVTSERFNDIKTNFSNGKSDAKTGKPLYCPICGKEMHEFDWGWGCTGYKQGCKFNISKTIAKKKLTKKDVTALLTKKETSKIDGFMSKAGKPFSASLILKPDNTIGFKF